MSEESEHIRLDPIGAIAATSPVFVSKPKVTDYSAVKSAVVAGISGDTCSGITNANIALIWSISSVVYPSWYC